MDYKKLSKSELIALVKNIENILNGITPSQKNTSNVSITNNSNSQNELENLIGTIPFSLLNQKIFEKNQEIADFAESIGVKIPSPEKKKREDMIGRIISAIARFDKDKISELNYALKTLNKTNGEKDKSNFFKDWENAIKQMKL